MQLWTIIDGDIYMEDSPYLPFQANPNGYDGYDHYVVWKYYINFCYWWYNTIKLSMNSADMPKKIQFWISTRNDLLRQEKKYGDRRIDLEVPIIYGDNSKEQNRIIVPD